MSLGKELTPYIFSGFPGSWVQTLEPEDAEYEIECMCREEGFFLYRHTPKDGLMRSSATTPRAWTPVLGQREVRGQVQEQPTQDFIAALTTFRGAEQARAAEEAGSVEARSHMVLLVWHGHLYGDGFLEEIRETMNIGKVQKLHLVFMSHVVKPHDLIRPRIAILNHELPDQKQLAQMAKSLLPEATGEEPEFKASVAAAAGLTRIEAENAFSLSIYEHSQLKPEVIFGMKAQFLKTGNQSLVLCTDPEPAGFSDVGGLMSMKQYHVSILTQKHQPVKAKPKGSLLLGVPGGGKSWYTVALGREVNRPVLQCFLGRTRGGIQGQTEQFTDELFRKAERMAPSILFIDEIEKLFTGLKSSGSTDGGVKANQIGSFLTWMQSRKADVYLMATCNSIQAIVSEMPEFVRSQRFDRLFYLDYPCKEAQEAIWKIHLRAYGHLMDHGILPKHLMGREDEQPTADQIDDAFAHAALPPYETWRRWTGAEIESCCAEADLRGIPLAECSPSSMDDIAPEVIRETQQWAAGKTYAAEYEGKYEPDKHSKLLQQAFHEGNGTRQVVRRKVSKPSAN